METETETPSTQCDGLRDAKLDRVLGKLGEDLDACGHARNVPEAGVTGHKRGIREFGKREGSSIIGGAAEEV